MRKPLLFALSLLATSPAWSMEPLDNEHLADVTGQAGINLNVELKASIEEAAWVDDGGSAGLRNIVIDNGCPVPGSTCVNGPAKLGILQLPTAQIDVVQNQSGTKAIELTLADLTGVNQQLDEPAIIRFRARGDMFVGDSNLGSIEVRDITDFSGKIRVWGH